MWVRVQWFSGTLSSSIFQDSFQQLCSIQLPGPMVSQGLEYLGCGIMRGCWYCFDPQSFLDSIVFMIPVFVRMVALECRPPVKDGVSTQSSKAPAHGGRSGLSKSFNMTSGLGFPRAFLTLLGLLEIRSLLAIGRYLFNTWGLLHWSLSFHTMEQHRQWREGHCESTVL